MDRRWASAGDRSGGRGARLPAVNERAIVDLGDVSTLGAGALTATYVWPYQSHGSIGPSCGIADVRDGKATIWSSTQGIFFLRSALATLLGLPNAAVRVKYVEGSGCYGHNGSDDAAADAALLSQAVGAPVRVQWMRDQEHGWDPKGPAMVDAQSARARCRRAARSPPGAATSGRPRTRRVRRATSATCWPGG